MANKKVVIGAAVAAAVLAGIAVAITVRNRKKSKYRAHVEEAKETFKGKLNDLQRKAEKEYKKAAGAANDVVNAAANRATEWANKA
jgi:predicted small secreted protein